MPTESVTVETWDELHKIIESGNAEHLAAFLQLLPPTETAYTISRLSDEEQTRMLAMLSSVNADFAADLMEHFADEQAADLLEVLEPGEAAAIFDEMDSDEQADVLSELGEADLEAILAEMDPEEAEDARERLQYDEHVAGGLMITEFLAYPEHADVDHVIADLRENTEAYREFEVRYMYVVDNAGRLKGVMSMRDLVLAPHGRELTVLLNPDVDVVNVHTQLGALEDIFDRHDFYAVPVVDDEQKLVGVVQRAAVQEALSERESDNFLKFSGIVGGEELRSMPSANRTARRLMFLLPNIILSYAAVSVIAFFEPVIKQLTALAIFLPMVANLSGAAGNQAVAVSIRELSLGVLVPADVVRVWRKEVIVGAVNGVIIGVLLGLVTWMTRSDQPQVAVIVGLAYAINCVAAVCLGGGLPLVLKRLGVDPAMMSSPILATFTDMGSFLLVLGMAAAALAMVSGA